MSLKLMVLFAILTLVTGSKVENTKNFREIGSFSELSLTERMLTLLMAQNNPNYKKIPHQFQNISSHPIQPQVLYSLFDVAYLEFGSLVHQSRHWGEKFPLPEINWQYGLTYCWCLWGDCFFCVDQAHSWTSRDSKFVGQETIQLKTDWTPNTFVQRFTIGNYTWWSPEGTTVEEDFLNGGVITCKGFWAKLENVTFLIAGTYHHDDTLGLQVDQLTLEFKAGNVSIGQLGCTSKWHGGEEEISANSTYYEFGEYLEEGFESYRRIVMHSWRTRINCVLSEGKYVPPPPAEDDEDWAYDKECWFEEPIVEHFVKMAAMQMLQMMAAGGLE